MRIGRIHDALPFEAFGASVCFGLTRDYVGITASRGVQILAVGRPNRAAGMAMAMPRITPLTSEVP